MPFLQHRGLLPTRVVVAAWAMPPNMLKDLLPVIQGWVFVVHSNDSLCLQVPKDADAWNLLRNAGAVILHMDLKDGRRDRAAYGKERHRLLAPISWTRPLRRDTWKEGSAP